MMRRIPKSVLDYHERACARAKESYVESISISDEIEGWLASVGTYKSLIGRLIDRSDSLKNLSGCIASDGSLIAVARHMAAPPISQDQLAIRCAQYKKTMETNGKPVDTDVAHGISDYLLSIIDPELKRILGEEGNAGFIVAEIVSRIMAASGGATTRRGDMSKAQEGALRRALEDHGYMAIDRKVAKVADFPLGTFAHKVHMTTLKGETHEMDTAICFADGLVLAVECKVSNDETNSVKRINDILKKAETWKSKFGEGVMTGALLQGVIGLKDVKRLLEKDVAVFWSHDLGELLAWMGRGGAYSEDDPVRP